MTFGQKDVLDREGDTALVLNGKSACVEIPSDAAFSQPMSGAGLTVKAWMRLDALEFIGEGEEGYVHWLGKGEAGKMEWVADLHPPHFPGAVRDSLSGWGVLAGEVLCGTRSPAKRWRARIHSDGRAAIVSHQRADAVAFLSRTS